MCWFSLFWLVLVSWNELVVFLLIFLILFWLVRRVKLRKCLADFAAFCSLLMVRGSRVLCEC